MFSTKIEDKVAEAVKILRANGVIAYPTDTLYGLGADPFSPVAVARVFEVKGRSAARGLPLLLAETEDMDSLVLSPSPLATTLAKAFWPGPLTLVLPSAPKVPKEVSGSKPGTVALRVPDHPIPRALARCLGGPIIGTSANVSGGPDPITAQDVERSLEHVVDYILDGGPARWGLPSTVLGLTGTRPRIVRLGALGREEIESVCGVPVELA